MKKLGIILGVLLGSFVLLILYFQALRGIDFMLQRQHLAKLPTWYETVEIPDESEFMGIDSTDSIRFNEIRFIASHNSYKKNVPFLGYIAIGLGENFDEARSLRYHTNTLTEQLFDGVRSFELDIRYRNNDYEIVHVPLVDHRSHAIDFTLALEEVKLFSINNPNHMPITLLLEIKDDWMILDPWLDDYDDEAFDVLDQIIIDTLQDHLFRPSMMLSNHETLAEAIVHDSWPFINDLRGKIIVIKHPSRYTEMYVNRDRSLQTLPMFPAVSQHHIDEDYAAFVVHNSPDIELIHTMIAQGLIVRTRADSNLTVDLTRRQDAIASDAQIITTDFYPNHRLEPSDYTMVFSNNKTMIETIIKQD